MLHALEHAFLDSLTLLPYLFLTYLALELLEHKAGDSFKNHLKNAGAWGPVAGALLGLIPQCGFCIAAVELLRGGVISFGTLAAVMISTSDEALPVLLAGGASFTELFLLLGGKAALAASVGLLLDAITKTKGYEGHHHELHHGCHSHCCSGGVLRTSLIHTAKSYTLIILAMAALHLIMEGFGEDLVISALSGKSVLVNLAATLFGFLPGCAPSIMLSNLYLEGALGFGGLMGGLITNTGLGLLALIRSRGHKDQKLILTSVLLGLGILFSVL